MAKAKQEAPAEQVNKTRMVEMAINELGNASPKEMQNHILQKHGVELSTGMISSYKSNILKKQGARTETDATVGVRDIAALRDMIERVGASELQQLIKVLSK